MPPDLLRLLQRAVSPILLASLVLALASRGLAAAAGEDIPAAPPLSELQGAIESGDLKLQQQITRPYLSGRGVPAGLSPRECSFIGIALQFQNSPRAWEFFGAARQHKEEYFRATFWLGEAALGIGNAEYAQLLSKEMERRDETHPAVPYLKGRIALDRFHRTAASIATKRDPLRTDVERALAACLGETARKHPGFDPRFLTLAVDFAAVTQDTRHLSEAYEDFIFYRPRNAVLFRSLLGLNVADLTEWKAKYLAAAAAVLPTEEIERWRLRATRFQELAGPEQALEGAIMLAEEADSNRTGAADLRPVRLFLLMHAAELLSYTWTDWLEATPPAKAPPGDARFAPMAVRFAAAAATGNSAQANLALRWSDLAARTVPNSKLPPDVELRLCLSTRDYPRARPLIAAAAPEHTDDFKWWQACWPALENCSLPIRKDAVANMARLQPDLSSIKFIVAREHLADPEALQYFERAFAVPPFIGTRASDWHHYHELLNDQDERNAFLNGKISARGENRFAETVTRWRNAATNDGVIAEQYAQVQIRRANLTTDRETVAAASQAVDAALELGSTDAGVVKSQPKLHAMLQNYRVAAAQQTRQQTSAASAPSAPSAEEIAERQQATEALRRKSEKTKERVAYLQAIHFERSQLNERLAGKLDAATHRQVASRCYQLDEIVRNFCGSCRGLGLSKRSGNPVCSTCNGTGKVSAYRPGPSAGFSR